MNFNNGSICFISLGYIFVCFDYFFDDIFYWVISFFGGYYCIWKKGKVYVLMCIYDCMFLLFGIMLLEEMYVYY